MNVATRDRQQSLARERSSQLWWYEAAPRQYVAAESPVGQITKPPPQIRVCPLT